MNVHLYPTAFLHETRILRVTRTLRDRGLFDEIVIIAGLRDRTLKRNEVLDSVRRVWRVDAGYHRRSVVGRIWSTLWWSVQVVHSLRGQSVACVSAHSLAVLPVGAMLKWLHSCKLVYEPHEIETETSTIVGVARLLAKVVERVLIGYADERCFTSEGHANWYANEYGAQSRWVVRNVPYAMPASRPRSRNDLRRQFNLSASDMLFLYQGVLSEPRGVHLLLDVFAHADSDRHIVFMGYGPSTELVQQVASRHANVHYVPAVTPNEVQEVTATADVGIHMMDASCVNHLYALPNKVLEYLNAGLPAIVSALPEMSRLVVQSGAGWVVEVGNASELASLIATLDREDVRQRAARASKWAASNSWERESDILAQMYRGLGFGSCAAMDGEAADA